MLQNYVPILVFFGVALGLGLLLMGAGFLFGPRKPDAEKLSAYECGFDAFEDSRMKFDVRYYLVAIVFIVFDLEIALIRAVCSAGASFINDVRGLADPEALQAAADSAAAVCVMHMQGDPKNMQPAPAYRDVVAEVIEYLALRIAACRNAGIDSGRIVIDPGIGFGKRVEHNLALLGQLRRLATLRTPILIGVSRKSLIGAVTGRAVNDRLAGSLAFATAAALAGASIIRAHDVGQTVDAVKIAAALHTADQTPLEQK